MNDRIFYALYNIIDDRGANPEMMGNVAKRYRDAYGEDRDEELIKMVQLAIDYKVTEDEIAVATLGDEELHKLALAYIKLVQSFKNKKGGYKRRSNSRKKRSRKKRSLKKLSRKKRSLKKRSRKKRSRK